MMNRPPVERIAPKSVVEPAQNEPPMAGREDKVLDVLHQCTDGNPRRNCDNKTKEALHREFETCEAYATYLAYAEGSLPTIENMTHGIEAMLAQAPQHAKEGPEAERVCKMLSGRALQIRAASRSYVQSVITFNRQLSGAGQFRLSDEERRDQLIDTDKRRRRLHDALLDTLRVTYRTLMDAVDLGIANKSTFGIWEKGFDARQLPGTFSIFAPQALDDRNFIRNWAIAADFAQTFAKLDEIVQKSETHAKSGA